MPELNVSGLLYTLMQICMVLTFVVSLVVLTERGSRIATISSAAIAILTFGGILWVTGNLG